jgi:hypothetical protein
MLMSIIAAQVNMTLPGYTPGTNGTYMGCWFSNQN